MPLAITPSRRPDDLPPVQNAEPSLIIQSPNYYVLTFMPPGQAEAILEADVRKTFDFILSRGGIWDKDAFAQMPEDSDERQMNLLAMIQRDDPPGDPFMSDEVMSYFTATYESTGFAKGLNWYRAISKMGRIMANAPSRIEVPSL